MIDVDRANGWRVTMCVCYLGVTGNIPGGKGLNQNLVSVTPNMGWPFSNEVPERYDAAKSDRIHQNLRPNRQCCPPPTTAAISSSHRPACFRAHTAPRSEPRLAFKCGKSAQSPPLTRSAARLSSWCSLNRLNNEGISEMPRRHYTPTIRARSE